jgi:hypothetical protein
MQQDRQGESFQVRFFLVNERQRGNVTLPEVGLITGNDLVLAQN